MNESEKLENEVIIPSEDVITVEDGGSAGAAAAASAADGAPVGGEAPAVTEESAVTEAPAAEVSQDVPTGAPEAVPEAPHGGAPCENSGDDIEISDSDMRKIMADPMFIGFAKGKNQDISSLCRDFCEMLKAGDGARQKTNLDTSVLMRVTPDVDGTVYREVALTDRQRALAREAGMSYREYYDLISGIPMKK